MTQVTAIPTGITQPPSRSQEESVLVSLTGLVGHGAFHVQLFCRANDSVLYTLPRGHTYRLLSHPPLTKCYSKAGKGVSLDPE